MDEVQEAREEYTKPKIVDHGDLQELTAQGGAKLSDVPIGNPPAASNP